MKINKHLIPIFLVLFAIFGIGCAGSGKKAVSKVIKNELDLLKNLDTDTTKKYISYQELFPDASDDASQFDSIEEVFSLFFRDFDYKILDINVNKKKNTADAALRLDTLDAQALARDYAKALLTYEIIEAAADRNTEGTVIPLEKRYLILDRLLTENEYETVERSCTISLKFSDDTNAWNITRTYALENDLVGGLITYLSDPDILSPEDTLSAYLNTLKKMNKEEMSNFLGIESLLNTEDSVKNEIAQALVDQVHSSFDYKILDSSINSYQATVSVSISAFDSDAIIDAYQKELDSYLETASAVIDGVSKRQETSYQMLLDAIRNNTKTRTTETVFTLINDGVSWKLENPTKELGDAIFGTLSTSPVE